MTWEEIEKEFDGLYFKGVGMGDGISMENPYLKYASEQIKSFLHKAYQAGQESVIENINIPWNPEMTNDYFIQDLRAKIKGK